MTAFFLKFAAWTATGALLVFLFLAGAYLLVQRLAEGK